MKNLANCKPSEFLVQTNKIRKYVNKWLDITGVMNIRKTVPVYEEGQSKEERKAALEAQSKINLNRMLDSIMEEHPKETLELLAMMCFIEPEKADDYPVSFYLQAFSDIIGDKAVLNFFTSLVQLEKLNTSTV